MKGQTYVIFAIVFTIVISVFAVLNIDSVEVNYLFWRGESPLIFVILFSVLLGGVLTTVVGAGRYIKMKREIKELQAELDSFELENHTKEPFTETEDDINNYSEEN